MTDPHILRPALSLGGVFTAEEVARICHEAVRELCDVISDPALPAWQDAPEWQRQSAINGVWFHASNPDARPEDSHENWRREKLATGWTWGPIKDAERRQHPCMVPYEDLPAAQRAKDMVFSAIAKSLRPLTILA